MAFHSSETGLSALHPVWYESSSDPGAIGAGKLWLDTTAGGTIAAGAILKERNTGNSGWNTFLSQTALSIVEANLSLSDVTTDNVTSTKHGFAPKSPADATQYLNGGATPAWSVPTTTTTQSAHDNSTHIASTAYVDTPDSVSALVDGATITWTVAGRREALASVTLGGSRTLSITNAVAGSAGILWVTQDGSGSRGLTLPSGSKQVGGGGTTAGLSTAPSTTDILAFTYDGTNYWWTIGKAAA